VSPSRFIAYVALPDPARVTGADLAARLRQRFPQWAPAAEAVSAPGGGVPPGGFILLVGGRSLLVSFVDAPLPPDVFTDDALQRIWPGWAEAARAQRAHAIVANLDAAADTAAAAGAAALVIAAAAALTELLPGALGVHWAASGLFAEPAAFRGVAVAMTPERLPVEVLVKPRWHQGRPPQPPTAGLVTLGLAPFVGREIEHPATGEAPVAVYERAMNLALYLMRAGPVIRDGDTVGTTPTQRIAVARGEQGGVPTYRLEFVSAGERAPNPPAAR